MTNLDENRIADAIDHLRRHVDSPDVHFGGNIRAELLENAIAKFASQAGDEDALMLVCSTGAGKAGFLFTDRAFYFGEAWGTSGVRIPWDEVLAVNRDRRLLQVKARDGGFKWDLTATLLHERSRSKIANIVVDALRLVLNTGPGEASVDLPTDKGAQAADGPPAAADEQHPVVFQTEDVPPADWARLLWFHAPVFLIGGCVLLPLLYSVLADWGAFGSASSRLSAKGSDRFLLGLMSIIPVVFAFGKSLKFSVGRFIAAVFLLGFLQISIAVRSAALGGPVAPVMLGGGIVGIGLGYALGYGGLELRRRLGAIPKAVRRNLGYVLVGAIVVAVLLAGSRFMQDRRFGNAGFAEHPRAVILDDQVTQSAPHAGNPYNFEGVWYCDNVNDNTESGEQTEWLSNLTIGRADGEQFTWRIRDQLNGQWTQGFGGNADSEGRWLILSGVEGNEFKFEYRTDLLDEGQLLRNVTQQNITSMSSCCPFLRCSEFEVCRGPSAEGPPYCL